MIRLNDSPVIWVTVSRVEFERPVQCQCRQSVAATLIHLSASGRSEADTSTDTTLAYLLLPSLLKNKMERKQA